MGIDSKAIRERLAKLQQKNSGGDKIDYSKIYFKPSLGKQTVRIVPSKFDHSVPYKEVVFHNYQAFKKSVYALSNWGEKDPIVQFRKKLFEENTDESKAIAKKLAPRTRYYFWVIVRGQENLGVRLWEMGKTTFESVLSIMAQDDEYGDITDIVEGTDLTVEGYEAVMEATKQKYIDVNITPKRKQSALSEDSEQVEEWLDKQQDPLEVHKKYDYNELKEMMTKYLVPEDEETEEEQEEEAQVVKQKPAVVKGKAPAAKKKVDLDEEEEEEVEEAEEVEEVKPVKKATTAKPATKTAPVPKKKVDFDDDEDDAPFEVDEEEEVPEVVKGAKVTAKKAPASAPKKTVSQKFAAAFDDDEDE